MHELDLALARLTDLELHEQTYVFGALRDATNADGREGVAHLLAVVTAACFREARRRKREWSELEATHGDGSSTWWGPPGKL